MPRHIVFFLVFAGLASALFLWRAPPQHNPFTPVDLSEPPGLATRYKLARLAGNPHRCFVALDRAGVIYTPLPNSPRGEPCGHYDALVLERSLTPYAATLRMTCAQTAALHYWERHIARPAAIEILGTPLARIETYGSFSCRNIAGTNRKSEHARSNAIDISGFRLESGRLIDVRAHWDNGGPEGRFLARLHRGGCRVFSVALGPDYDAAHADHFHFDMGSGDACR